MAYEMSRLANAGTSQAFLQDEPDERGQSDLPAKTPWLAKQSK